jgi:hypothetical protein
MIAVEKVLTVLWIGSLWTIGAIVAPTLFHVLADHRAQAGMIAGHLFSIESYLGLICGGILLGLAIIQSGLRLSWQAGLLIAMLLIIVGGEFFIRPLLADLKAQGLASGAKFACLHAVSATLYLINSLLGLVWVIVARWD